jgi:hypothetical protein
MSLQRGNRFRDDHDPTRTLPGTITVQQDASAGARLKKSRSNACSPTSEQSLKAQGQRARPFSRIAKKPNNPSGLNCLADRYVRGTTLALGAYVQERTLLMNGNLSARYQVERSRTKTMLNDRHNEPDPIDRLQKLAKVVDADATRVELLAAIMSGWAKPVPGYLADEQYRVRPGRARRRFNGE